MTPDVVTKVAKRIIGARRSGTALPSLDQVDVPKTPAEGYRLQDAIHAAWGEPMSGWKIGATAAAVQARFALSEPFSGPFYASTTYRAPAAVPAHHLQHRKIESEFAFRFGHALAPRSRPYARSEVLDAVDAMIPAIEVVSPRFRDMPFGLGPLAIADWGVNGAMIFGTPVLNGWRERDLAAHAVRLRLDGTEVASGTGALVLGGPVNSLEWAVEHLRQRGITIAAGHIISTGTTTGIVDLAIGQKAEADFGDFGRVEMRFEAREVI